jgi:hypothetical protein
MIKNKLSANNLCSFAKLMTTSEEGISLEYLLFSESYNCIEFRFFFNMKNFIRNLLTIKNF